MCVYCVYGLFCLLFWWLLLYCYMVCVMVLFDRCVVAGLGFVVLVLFA